MASPQKCTLSAHTHINILRQTFSLFPPALIYSNEMKKIVLLNQTNWQSACMFVSVDIKYHQRLHHSNGMRMKKKVTKTTWRMMIREQCTMDFMLKYVAYICVRLNMIIEKQTKQKMPTIYCTKKSQLVHRKCVLA